MITMIVELSCDRDGCDVAYAPSPEEMTSVRATRVGSTIAGWTRSDGRDYCPGCSGTIADSPIVAQVRELAAKGRNDGEIAVEMDRPRWWVQQFRTKHGIKAGTRPGRPAKRRTQPRQAVAS